jgi:hypothetical protein
MHRGAKTGDETVRQDPAQHQWVKKNVEPQNKFDEKNEKALFKKERQ